jgi:hypothetical protein
MKTSVVEPLQSALEHIPTPDLSNIHVPTAVVDRLPDRLRPAKKSSKRPWMIGAIVLAVIVAMLLAKKRQSSHQDIASYNGSAPSRSGDASLVDVR